MWMWIWMYNESGAPAWRVDVDGSKLGMVHSEVNWMMDLCKIDSKGRFEHFHWFRSPRRRLSGEWCYTADMVIFTLSLAFLLSVVSAQAQTTCSNYGTTSTTNASQCICPPGFLQETDCLQPQCGGNLLVGGNNQAPLSTGTSGLRNVSAGSCGCDDGWNGPVCSGE
jgi:hypothetical protein